MSASEHRAVLLSWLAENGYADAVADDPDMPTPPEDRPLTLRQFSDELCDAEDLTDPVQRERRWKTIQRWPQRLEKFPVPAIAYPRKRTPGPGRTAAIYSARRLYGEMAEYAPRTAKTDPELLDALGRRRKPMTLVGIARALELDPDTLYRARDASLLRRAQGADPDREVPDPKWGHHYESGALYPPAAWARFWRSRPGQGRRT